MKSKIKWFNLAVIAYLFTLIPVSAAVDVDHLNRAKTSITTKHYHQGYLRFKQMADHGCPFSQCILGIMHQTGTGVEKDGTQAVYWFEKSAQQGFADAEKRLGLMYYQGDGVAKNLNIAKTWLRRAADHGEEEAKELLAQMPQIPGENAISNDLAQAPNNVAGTLDNIHKAWQGYTDVTKQLDQAAAAASSQ